MEYSTVDRQSDYYNARFPGRTFYRHDPGPNDPPCRLCGKRVGFGSLCTFSGKEMFHPWCWAGESEPTPKMLNAVSKLGLTGKFCHLWPLMQVAGYVMAAPDRHCPENLRNVDFIVKRPDEPWPQIAHGWELARVNFGGLTIGVPCGLFNGLESVVGKKTRHVNLMSI